MCSNENRENAAAIALDKHANGLGCE